jgi:cbb3-type cytochrome oxidase subunit 3
MKELNDHRRRRSLDLTPVASGPSSFDGQMNAVRVFILLFILYVAVVAWSIRAQYKRNTAQANVDDANSELLAEIRAAQVGSPRDRAVILVSRLNAFAQKRDANTPPDGEPAAHDRYANETASLYDEKVAAQVDAIRPELAAQQVPDDPSVDVAYRDARTGTQHMRRVANDILTRAALLPDD